MYRLTNREAILRLADGAEIPKVEGNRDYEAYLAWVSEGNVPEPFAPEPVSVPQPVPMRKAKQYLNQIDKYEAVDAHFASLTGKEGRQAQIFWRDSQYVERYRDLTLSMFAMLGVDTEEERDQWFIDANALP